MSDDPRNPNMVKSLIFNHPVVDNEHPAIADFDALLEEFREGVKKSSKRFIERHTNTGQL